MMVSLAPQLPKAHFRLGAACEKLGEHAVAAGHFAEALRIDPFSGPAEDALCRTMASARLRTDTSNTSAARLLQKCNAALAASKAAQAAKSAEAFVAAPTNASTARRSIEWVRVDTTANDEGQRSTPPARGGATLTALAGSLWLIGGADRTGAQDSAVWQYLAGPAGIEHSAGIWVRHEPQGDAFTSRNGHAASASSDAALVVFGGKNANDELLDDLFVLKLGGVAGSGTDAGGSLPSWSRTACGECGHRAEHSLCFSGGVGYMFGGADEAGLRSDLLIIEEIKAEGGPQYCCKKPECGGSVPSARGMHAAAVVELSATPTLIIHGGRGGDGSVNLQPHALMVAAPHPCRETWRALCIWLFLAWVLPY